LSAGQKLKKTALVMQNVDRQLVMPTVLDELAEAWPGGRPDLKKLSAELSAWGLGQLAGRHPQSLSGGEKQRLALAAALNKKSELLVLDEPASGLDGRNLALAARAFNQAATHKAVLMITHDLDLLALTSPHEVKLTKTNF
jgi:energy-coupling factor transport system ATP-binding protein